MFCAAAVVGRTEQPTEPVKVIRWQRLRGRQFPNARRVARRCYADRPPSRLEVTSISAGGYLDEGLVFSTVVVVVAAGVVTPSSSSETWASALSPGWSGLDLESCAMTAAAPGVVTTARFGSPDPARWLRSCFAAFRPSRVLSYLMPMVCSASPCSRRLISSTPCIREWSVLATSYFHMPNRPRE